MNVIISVGSIDGIFTAAAVKRFLINKGEKAELFFTQAFTVWEVLPHIPHISEASIYLVDLAVCNSIVKTPDGEISGHEYTSRFIEGLIERGKVKGIADEHGSADWQVLIDKFELDLDLEIYPKDRSSEYPSSGAVFRDACAGDSAFDETCLSLTQAADAADQGVFEGDAFVVARCTKVNMTDNVRRVHLSNLLHNNISLDNDPQVKKWLEEANVLDQHKSIAFASVEDHGEWIFISTRDLRVNITEIAFTLYERYPRAKVVIAESQAYNKDVEGVIPCYRVMVSKNNPGLNALLMLQEEGVPAWGIPVNASFPDEEAYLKLAISLIEGRLPTS